VGPRAVAAEARPDFVRELAPRDHGERRFLTQMNGELAVEPSAAQQRRDQRLRDPA
jgi:hypothetical protein